MEVLIPIILMLFVSGIPALVKGKQQKALREQEMAKRREAHLQQVLRMQQAEENARKMEKAPSQPLWQQPAPARMSGEGKDDCHAYMLDDTAHSPNTDEKTDEERQQAANDLIRGVIIGEILRRPRPVYGRKRA